MWQGIDVVAGRASLLADEVQLARLWVSEHPEAGPCGDLQQQSEVVAPDVVLVVDGSELHGDLVVEEGGLELSCDLLH